MKASYLHGTVILSGLMGHRAMTRQSLLASMGCSVEPSITLFGGRVCRWINNENPHMFEKRVVQHCKGRRVSDLSSDDRLPSSKRKERHMLWLYECMCSCSKSAQPTMIGETTHPPTNPQDTVEKRVTTQIIYTSEKLNTASLEVPPTHGLLFPLSCLQAYHSNKHLSRQKEILEAINST